MSSSETILKTPYCNSRLSEFHKTVYNCYVSSDFLVILRDTLMSIAKHYETGESLPEEVYQKLLAARTFRAGSLSLRQVSVTTCIVFDHGGIIFICFTFLHKILLPKAINYSSCVLLEF